MSFTGLFQPELLCDSALETSLTSWERLLLTGNVNIRVTCFRSFQEVDVNATCGLLDSEVSSAIHCGCVGVEQGHAQLLWSSQAGAFAASLGARGAGSPVGWQVSSFIVCSSLT